MTRAKIYILQNIDSTKQNFDLTRGPIKILIKIFTRRGDESIFWTPNQNFAKNRF